MGVSGVVRRLDTTLRVSGHRVHALWAISQPILLGGRPDPTALDRGPGAASVDGDRTARTVVRVPLERSLPAAVGGAQG
jgi:hypothetical protein